MKLRKLLKPLLALFLAFLLFAEPVIAGAAVSETTAPVGEGTAVTIEENGSQKYISELRIYKSSSDKRSETVSKAQKEGFTLFMSGNNPVNINEYTDRDEIYLAYKKCSALAVDLTQEQVADASDDFDESWFGDDDWDFDDEMWADFDFDFDIDIPEESVIRDILCVIGRDAGEGFTYKGAEYKRVSETSLNLGTNGRTIRLYYTTDSYTDEFLPPLTSICLCSGDAVPSKDDIIEKYGRWEKILDTNGREANLNDRVIIKQNAVAKDASAGMILKDCSLYLFVQRYGGGVKADGEIDRGAVDSAYSLGDLILA